MKTIRWRIYVGLVDTGLIGEIEVEDYLDDSEIGMIVEEQALQHVDIEWEEV